jgi:uncharacterized protein (TIGR02266 family)
MGNTRDERLGNSPPESTQERRESPRIPVEMWVEESTERELYFQRSGNLSIGGIFLENTIPHPKGTVVNLQFTLPGDTQPIRVRGEIVNAASSDELGMGIKFVDVAPDVERRIGEFVRHAEVTRR